MADWPAQWFRVVDNVRRADVLLGTPHQPGAAIAGRAVGPLPFDGRTLGADFARIRPPLPGFMLLGGMMVGKADIQALVGRYGSWKDFLHSARLVARYAADRLRHPRGTRLVMGNALVARLFQSLLAAKVDVRFGWRLRDLEVHEGRVVGASFDQADGAVRHVAAPAVVLATGGVGHQAALRRELVPDGDSFRSLAAESVRGDGMLAARRAGADCLYQPGDQCCLGAVHRSEGCCGSPAHSAARSGAKGACR